MQLSQPASYYAPATRGAAGSSASSTRRFAEPSKKYLVYYDGVVDEPRLCGQSTVAPDQGGRFAYSVVYAQACHADVGTGVVTASVVAHELGHNLGAVPPGGPPHACDGDAAHVCDDENDLMFPFTRGQGLNAVSLDAGHDDYYAHSGAWWDLQDSAWLAHLDAPQFALDGLVGGTGKRNGSSRAPRPGSRARRAARPRSIRERRSSSRPSPATTRASPAGAVPAPPTRVSVTMSSAQTVVALFIAQDSA